MEICRRCNLIHGNKYNNINYGNPKAKLLILRSYASAAECTSGKFNSGKQNKYLLSVLKDLGLTKNDYYITNVLRCYPNNPIYKINIDICTDYLKELLKQDDKVILTLGKLAYNFVSGKSININVQRIVGKTLYIGNHVIITNYSIGYILHNKDKEDEFYEYFRKAIYEINL